MNENEFPVVECSVTFLPESEGGRHHPPAFTTIYRPHVVVGNLIQQKIIVKNRFLTNIKNRLQPDEYLGVAFLSGQSPFEFNKPLYVQLVCMYYPYVDYSKLTLGAIFTIREGHRIVGYGEVVRCSLFWNNVTNHVTHQSA